MKDSVKRKAKVREDMKASKRERLYMELTCNPAKSHKEIMEETNRFRKRLGFEPIPVQTGDGIMKFNFDDFLMLITWLNMAIVMIYVFWIFQHYGTDIAMTTLFHFQLEVKEMKNEGKVIVSLTCAVVLISIIVLVYVFSQYGIDPSHCYGIPIF